MARELNACRDHTPRTLGAVLRREIVVDDIAPFIRFDPKNYVRALVARGEHWEIRLLCWRPGQTSTLHGHGTSACAFRVLRGSATESILGSRDRVLAPGDLVEESVTDLVHQVGNAGTDPLLTLHVYSPPLPVDAPSPREGRTIVVVGGGFAGVAVATHLLRRARRDEPLRIFLLERGPWLGRGVAYGVESEIFRLNVAASRMSLDPETPDDFVRWAHAEDAPHAFLPRTTYGSYVVSRFADALRDSSGKLRVVRGEAIEVNEKGIVLSNGATLPAEAVVLATGIQPRLAPGALPEDPRIVDAWDESALATLPLGGKVLILGSGLTALDVLAFLEAHAFSGTATVLSRRALLPRPHAPSSRKAEPLSADLVRELPASLRAAIAWGRRVIGATVLRGDPWQHGIDAIRPHIPRLWQGLSPRDRARFVRSVRPYWDVLRHRVPADALDLVEEWRRRGQLVLEAGAIVQCLPKSGGLEVEVRGAGGRSRVLRYEAIVRCVGPALERTDADTPLLRALVADGRAEMDPAGLGILTGAVGQVTASRDHGVTGGPRVFAIGALQRASFWETTSVPDIAIHALAIAKELVPSS